MKLTLPITILPALVASVLSTPIHISRDVYVPPVTYPVAGTVWTVNTTQTVTWDVSDPPVNITNRYGEIRLREGDLLTPLVLADGFDILLGQQEVTVPWVLEGADYSIVLFGDSGNWSPDFTITGGPEY
ncbi:uncharacterized protein BT62DRAFT_995051 [Guyanagaster necrorhizus]|uniref:Uncharacterized protein n=1 Tax=Guyanagaster necrorhizus TaxID=856835 RepID=A0A9P7VPM1_9AGAR|nr:uncharacterized protein BT62DRAFT_995051 [Guyanagaster necrorhizus MCA 3950]KAG7445081.1 hypothetical protein BT62DRAFT_995051 [Guyanagaster necrorhizus MCA 3950]